MTIVEIFGMVLFPVLGWLLLNSMRTQGRLSRIETMLEFLMTAKHQPNKKNE
jgi:hypothetical protein